MNSTNNKLYVLVALALVCGVGLTLLVASVWGLPWTDSDADADPSASASHEGHDHADGEDSDTYYTCPMHPSVVSDSPGACPVCGMDLIEKSDGGAGMDSQELAAMGQVALSPTQRVLANVQVTEVEASGASSAGELRAVGIVAYDETGLATIPSWVEGRIERLLIEETGATVQQGQPVIEIYSPELLAAQEEFLVALDSTDQTMVGATRQRLELLGMSDSQIAELRRTRDASERVTMTAPNAGTITELMVRQGQYVEEGAPLYEIADLSNVWVEAEVYEHNLGDIEEGMDVRVTADAFRGESLAGEVAFIHPMVGSETRTVKVRIELDNEDGRLRPGMYTSVFFETDRQPAAQDDTQAAQVEMLVPKSAVIRGGKTSSVFVEVDDNVFERRQVEVGRATDDYLVLSSGVEIGEEVAYRGGFLLDSEVQLSSFGGSEHAGHGDHGEQSAQADQAQQGGHEGHGEMAEELSAEDIAAEGQEFDPPVPTEAVPEGMWFCDMGTAHWIQHEEGDGECPICGMHLKQKEAE